MLQRFALLLILLAPCRVSAGESPLIDSLVGALNGYTLGGAEVRDPIAAQEFIRLSESGRHGDVTILDLYTVVTLPDSACMRLLAEQRADGTWPDIDYADTKRSCWSPADHLTRLLALTKVYKSPDSTFAGDPQLFGALRRAIDYWLTTKPVCRNWWYNQIGCPRMLFSALLLLKEQLPQRTLLAATKLMAKPTFEMTGQNMAATAGNNLMRGLLLNNVRLVLCSRNELASVILLSEQEGIQSDYSFHQHGAQLQFGNYGLAYAVTLSQWARVLAGSSLAFSAEAVALLGNFILDGLQWTVFRGRMDINACGRQVFQHAQRGKALSLAVSCLNMAYVDRQRAAEYGLYVSRHLPLDASESEMKGHKHYFRSDFTVHQHRNWYASVRMCSERIIGFETTNSENLQGIYSSDGATLLSVVGDEHLDIFPIWNWRRLPGVTCPSQADSLRDATVDVANKSTFVGGVGDGTMGCSAMLLDNTQIQARKSYFFIANTLTCLGSGIAGKTGGKVATTINQTHLRGAVTTNVGPLREYSTMESQAVQWVHHDQTGYYLLEPARVCLSNSIQHGDWRQIALFYPSKPLSGAVFLLSLDHGAAPRGASYAYSLLPGQTATQTAQFATSPQVRLLSNTDQLQAVASTDGTCAQYVFYAPGKSQWPNHLAFEALQPMLLMVQHMQDTVLLHLSDPTQKQTHFTLRIKGHIKARNARYDAQAGATEISGFFPTEAGARGASVSITCRL